MKTSSFFRLSLYVCLLSLPALAQEKAAQVPERVDANTFSILRPMGYYVNRLSDDFAADLAKLGPDSHWIDGGSGEGVAIEHYHQLGTNPKATMYSGGNALKSLESIGRTKAENRAYVTGITYHMLRTQRPNYANRLRHLSGRLMEEIPQKEIGRADLISDVYGVYAYTEFLDVTLRMYLTALKRHGKIYLFHHPRMFDNIVTVDKKEFRLPDWLGTIRNIRVDRVGPFTLRITKTGGAIDIPRLHLDQYDRQEPPLRRFTQLQGHFRVEDVEDGNGPQVDFTRPTGPHVPRNPPALTAEQVGLLRMLLGYDPLAR